MGTMTKGQTSVLARLLVSQSGEQDRRTPLEAFKELNKEFNFELDPCTSSEKNGNLGTPYYFTKEQDGLKQDWSKFKSIFINPPFNQLPKKNMWVKKIHDELEKSDNMTIVLLVPSKTETEWYHSFLTSKFLKEVRFQKGRMTFEGHETSFIIGITYFILISQKQKTNNYLGNSSEEKDTLSMGNQRVPISTSAMDENIDESKAHSQSNSLKDGHAQNKNAHGKVSQ